MNFFQKFKRYFASSEDKALSGMYGDTPESHLDRYPQVPPPESESSPRLLAARWAAGDLYVEHVPSLAADLLEMGHDTPSLRRLAGEAVTHHSADLEPLIARTFQELGVVYPLTESQEKLYASRQIAREVIYGLRNPWAAASNLEVVIWNWRWVDQVPAFEIIYSINDELTWDDESMRRTKTEMKSALIEAFASLASLSDSEIFQPPTVRKRN